MAELSWEGMPIHQAIKADWKSPEILIEGSLGCAKTTVALDKEIDAVLKWPGIPILLFRWTEDAVATKLRTAFDELLAIRELTAEWDAKQKFYQFENGSRVFMFGLKAVSLIEEFNKIRGLGVARVTGDQVEEMRPSVAGELRGRLRPDLTATMRGLKFPFQLTFVANPSDDEFWLSKEFPLDGRVKGRTLYSLSIFDNPHLPQETKDGLIRTYAEDHPKHRTMVLGQRGPSVTGVAVYENLYRKDIHWHQIDADAHLPFFESFEFGKHTPVWILAQPMAYGGLSILGGVLGQQMMLEDFLPIVEQYRQQWLPEGSKVKACTSPMGQQVTGASARYTPLTVLRECGIQAVWRDNGNAADVRSALIENIAGYLRRRNAKGEESFALNSDASKFVIASKTDGERFSPFVHHAFEGGAVWDPHYTSVANKELRQMAEDDKFANVMHAIENIELNFCAGQETEAERRRRASSSHAQTDGVPFPTGPNSWMAF